MYLFSLSFLVQVPYGKSMSGLTPSHMIGFLLDDMMLGSNLEMQEDEKSMKCESSCRNWTTSQEEDYKFQPCENFLTGHAIYHISTEISSSK